MRSHTSESGSRVGRALRLVGGLALGYAVALMALAVAGRALAETSPSPLAIAEGAHVIPYQGYVEVDGTPLDGPFEIELTLAAGGESVVETVTTAARSGFFHVEIGASTPLPEWVFVRDDVTLTLAVDGNPLGAPQRLYPARVAVHGLENRDVSFTGATTVGDRLRVRGTSPPAWSPGDPVQVELRDGTGFGGEGLGATYFTASGFAFDAGSSRGSDVDAVELTLGADGASVVGSLDVSGTASVAGDVTLGGAADPFSLPNAGWVVLGDSPGAWRFGDAGSLRVVSEWIDDVGVIPPGFDAARSISIGVDETEIFHVTAEYTEIASVYVTGDLRFRGATQVIESPFGLSQDGERVECPAGEVMVGLADAGGFERYDIVCTDSNPPADP